MRIAARTEEKVRAPRSVPASYPPGGAWPAEMRAATAAAFLDFATTGKLLRAIVAGEAPRPSSSRLEDGRRVPLWSLDALRGFVAGRHGTPVGGAPAAARESVRDLL